MKTTFSENVILFLLLTFLQICGTLVGMFWGLLIGAGLTYFGVVENPYFTVGICGGLGFSLTLLKTIRIVMD